MTSHAAAGFVHYAKAGQMGDRSAGTRLEAMCGAAFVPVRGPRREESPPPKVCPDCSTAFATSYPPSKVGRPATAGRSRSPQQSTRIRLVD